MSNTTGTKTSTIGTIFGVISIAETLLFLAMFWFDRNDLNQVSVSRQWIYAALAVTAFFGGVISAQQQSAYGSTAFLGAVLMLGLGYCKFGWF